MSKSNYQHQIDFTGTGGWVDVGGPQNEEAIRFDIVSNAAAPSISVQSINLIWLGDTAKQIYKYFEDGMNGGRGITVGLPYRILACGGAVVFDLKLDLANSAARFSCDEIQCPIVQVGRVDWVAKISEKMSFWALFATNFITPADYKKTPYCLDYLPEGTTVFTLTIAEFMVIWQGYQLVMMISDFITKITGDFTNLPLGAGVVAADLLIAVSIALYAYFLINLFIKMLAEIKKNIIQAKKYKLCMREKDVFLKICGWLKLQYVSPIHAPGAIDENATWMPSKIVMPATGQSVLNIFDRPEDEGQNVHAYGYPDGTVQEFFQTMMLKYNADITIENGTLYFKEKHDWNFTSAFQVPNTGEIGNTFNNPAPFATNLSELSPSYIYRYSMDDGDTTTKHKYRGTSVRVQLVEKTTGHLHYEGWGQPTEVILPFTLAKRKDYLNATELVFDKVITGVSKIVNAIIAPINGLIKLINKIINLFGGSGVTIPPINALPLNPLQQRIGWMECGGDTFGLPKSFIGMQVGADWVIAPNNEVDCGATALFNRTHGKNLATRGNQFLLFDKTKYHLCCADAKQLMLSNILITPDGKIGKFTKQSWWLTNELAENVDYRIQQDYTKNLTEKIITDETF